MKRNFEEVATSLYSRVWREMACDKRLKYVGLESHPLLRLLSRLSSRTGILHWKQRILRPQDLDHPRPLHPHHHLHLGRLQHFLLRSAAKIQSDLDRGHHIQHPDLPASSRAHHQPLHWRPGFWGRHLADLDRGGRHASVLNLPTWGFRRPDQNRILWSRIWPRNPSCSRCRRPDRRWPSWSQDGGCRWRRWSISCAKPMKHQ